MRHSNDIHFMLLYNDDPYIITLKPKKTSPEKLKPSSFRIFIDDTPFGELVNTGSKWVAPQMIPEYIISEMCGMVERKFGIFEIRQTRFQNN